MPEDHPLSFLLGGRNDNDDVEDAPLNPDLDAAVLADVFRTYVVEHPFEPGQVVRQKSGIRYYRAPAARVPAVFVRYLPEDERETDAGGLVEDAQIITLISKSGGDKVTAFLVVSSRLLEPYPEDELRAKPDDDDPISAMERSLEAQGVPT